MQLKRLSAMFSAVLVAFSCSFLPSVIDTAYAVDTTTPYAFSYRIGFNNYPSLDFADTNTGITPVLDSPSGYYRSTTALPYLNATPVYLVSNVFEAVPYERTLIITVGVAGSTANVTYSGLNPTSLTYNIKGDVYGDIHTLDSACKLGQMVNGGSITSNASRLVLVNITIPANTTNFSCQLPLKFTTSNASGFKAYFFTGGSYVVDSADNDLISLIQQIYTELLEQGATLDSIDSIMTCISATVSNIDTKVSSIYDLLKSALADESAVIDQQSKQVAESIMQQDNAEQYWKDKNQDNFDALDLDNFQFGGGVVNALGTVGSLFSSIWEVLGDMTVIWTFPLMLGITLVVIGRVSRSGGKGKDKGGDKE